MQALKEMKTMLSAMATNFTLKRRSGDSAVTHRLADPTNTDECRCHSQ